MIRPGKSNAKYEVELSDAKSKKRYGLKVSSLQINTVSQDDSIYIRSVGKRVGDFDEQRSWKGGRGVEKFNENPEGYYDSENAYTLTPGHVHQTLQWYHARGLRTEDVYMPTRSAGDVKFQPLIGTTRYVANSFSASATYSADMGYLWIRRRGAPGTLTFRLMSNSGGSPNSALKTVTKSISTITDYISVYQLFDWTSTESLTSSTTYWVSIHGASTDDKDNYWEVGVNPDTSSGKTSSDGSSWSSAGFAMYYRITDAEGQAKRFYQFILNEAMYLIDSKDNDSTASKLYLNGDRGVATSGSAITLSDTTKSWVTNRWAGAWIRIIRGAGRRNRPQKILSNTSTGIVIDGSWETNPTTTSQYVIYATEWFQEITPSGGSLSVCQGQPVSLNYVAYIPQGTTGIAHIQWNSTTLAHDIFVETPATTQGKADILYATIDSKDDIVVWRANNSAGTGSGGQGTVSYASIVSSGTVIAWNTSLTFKTPSIFCGSITFDITGINKKDDKIYVFREDGMGVINNGKFNTIESGIEKTPDRANGAFTIAHSGFLYYSWLHSLVRIFGSSHDDVGEDFRSLGLPDGREGEILDGDTYLKLLFYGIDAGSGTSISSVMAWDGIGRHEILRSPVAGRRVRMVKLQTCAGTRNRLWTQHGVDVFFQELPYKKASPILDSGCTYQHEGVLISPSIDMGTASDLPKMINELTTTVKNLSTNGREIYLDIQTDEKVGTTTWTPVGRMLRSPESKLLLSLNCNRFAYRLRFSSNSNLVPIDITGVIPNGYARTPYKMVFTMQIQAGGIFSRRGKIATSGELMRWLLDESRIAGFVKMDSVFEMAHGWRVIVHPPRQQPITPKRGRSPETSAMTLTLQEV